METTTDNKMLVLARELSGLRAIKDKLEDQIKELNPEIQRINDQLVELMVAENCPRFSLDGQTFYTAVQAIPKIVDELAFFEWLRKHNEEGIIKETIHSQTLRGWWKEVGSKYEEDLKGSMLEVFEQVQVRIRADSK